MFYFRTENFIQLFHVLARSYMLEQERIVSIVFQTVSQIIAHPWYMWLGKFNDVVSDVRDECDWISQKPGFFVTPELVQHVRQFQNSSSSVDADQDIPSVSQSFQNGTWKDDTRTSLYLQNSVD